MGGEDVDFLKMMVERAVRKATVIESTTVACWPMPIDIGKAVNEVCGHVFCSIHQFAING
jgi:hypothetical protein